MPPRKSPADEWVNTSDHAVTLASGQPLDAYGGRGLSDMTDPHDRGLRDARILIAGTRPVDYEDFGLDDLASLAEARELTVPGTGANGNALKKDYIAALKADDDSEKESS